MIDAQVAPCSVMCPVCGYTVAIPFFCGGNKPLTTLGSPVSYDEAKNMKRLPLNFVQCPCCTHIYNQSFKYVDVPYSDIPNRMFNGGSRWTSHLQSVQNHLLDLLPASPCLVDVGCGDGHFVKSIAKQCKSGRFVGLDPNGEIQDSSVIEFYPRLFDPFEDMQKFNPDAIVLRHVLEHFMEVSFFLDSIAWMTSKMNKTCLLFAEVPCADQAIAHGRLADFHYEHVSHFTTKSFTRLMKRVGDIYEIGHTEDGNFVYSIVNIQSSDEMLKYAQQTKQHFIHAEKSITNTKKQISAMCTSASQVVIWGGFGLGAELINLYDIDADRFPIVVDSDIKKVGMFVPGTGQRIQSFEILKDLHGEIIIIIGTLRYKDILITIQSIGIKARCFIEKNFQLIEVNMQNNTTA